MSQKIFNFVSLVSKIYPIWTATLSLVHKMYQRSIEGNILYRKKKILNTFRVRIKLTSVLDTFWTMILFYFRNTSAIKGFNRAVLRVKIPN